MRTKFTQQERSRLVRALNRQSPQHSEALRVVAQHTTRDMHPTAGSDALIQAVTAGKLPATQISLNVTVNGNQYKSFLWGVTGFGWGNGVLQ